MALFLILLLGFHPAVFSNNPSSGQIQKGRQIWPVDILTNILALPAKLLLWNKKYSNHHITAKTAEDMQRFIDKESLTSMRVRLNAYDPLDDFKRLATNKEVAFPFRIIAIPFTLINPFLGRFIGGIIVSDFYDPFSHTIYIYSDDSAIALHEAGHALDYSKQDHKGLYALSRLLPFVTLVQEQEATHHAIRFYQDQNMIEDELRAYKVLYPAYFSYIGGLLPVYPIGYVSAIFAGHFYGRNLAKNRKEAYEELAVTPNDSNNQT